jgi:hypothetical protein
MLGYLNLNQQKHIFLPPDLLGMVVHKQSLDNKRPI